jgi:hypothetical protein
MCRVSPINEEWHKPVSDNRPLIGDMPGQKNARWRAPASRYHVADWYAAAARLGDDLREVGSLCGPRDEPRHLQIVDSEFPRSERFWLIGVRTDYLEVRGRTEGDKGIASALAWMLPAGRCVDSQQCLDLLDASGQVRRRVYQMINPAEQRWRVTRLRV